eukprot:837993-Pelagomonas_calceolata.AAC.3
MSKTTPDPAAKNAARMLSFYISYPFNSEKDKWGKASQASPPLKNSETRCPRQHQTLLQRMP